MMPIKPKSTRGGARPGSGPKPLPPGEKKLSYATKLPQDVIAFLRDQDNAALTIEATIRKSAAFRKWAKA